MAVFSKEARHQSEIRNMRKRVVRWTLWECDEETLAKMLAEVKQESDKLDVRLLQLTKEFDQLVNAGDPITIDETRKRLQQIGQKWDLLQQRGHEIEDALRQRRLEQRIDNIGRQIRIDGLMSRLQGLRSLCLTLSIGAVLISLVFYSQPHLISYIPTLDTINLVCSILLTLDFLFRLTLIEDRNAYFRQRWFDIFVSLPLVNMVTPLGVHITAIARWITLLRIPRLIRLLLGETNSLRSIKFLRSVEFSLLGRTIMFAMAVLLFGAALIEVIEPQSGLVSIHDGLWWSFKIALTGNIDYSPETTLGRLYTLIIIVVGLSFTGILIATITAILVDFSDDDKATDNQQQSVDDVLANVQTQLDLLTNAKQKAGDATAHLSYLLLSSLHESNTIDTYISQLVTDFGCITASLHQLDEEKREISLISASGNSDFIPDAHIKFDNNQSLLGRAALHARKQKMGNIPIVEAEPMPLADGGAFAIPLMIKDQTVKNVGILHLVLPQDAFRDEHIKQLLLTVSSQLALYIHTQTINRIHGNLLESVSDLETTMESVTTTREYKALLFEIARGASTLVNADMSKLMLLDETRGELYAVAWHGVHEEIGRSLSSRLGEGLTGWAAKTEKVVQSSNLRLDNRFTPSAHTLRSGMLSEMAIPVRARGRLMGVLSVMSRQQHVFTREEEYLLSMLAGQAGAALENARIYEMEQHQLRIADSMNDIRRRMNQTYDEIEILRFVLATLHQAIPYDTATIFRVDGDYLQAIVAQGFEDPQFIHSLRFPIVQHKLFQQLARTHEPVLIEDLSQTDQWLAGPIEQGSWLGVPLIIGEHAVGMISMDRVEGHQFSEQEAQDIQRFALQASIALRLARLQAALNDCNAQQDWLSFMA